jgi:uncharacterized protein (TIGR03437 family)
MFRAPFVFVVVVAAASGQQYVMSTVAGGVPPVSPAAAPTVSIGDPPRVATDTAGNFYFGSLHSIFKVDNSRMMTRVAGTARAGLTGDGGPAISAQLMTPNGMVVDAAGNIYVTEPAANIIRKISVSGTISTFAGTGVAGYNGDGGPAAAAWFNRPFGLALDAAGNLYVADMGNNVIRRIAADGTVATVAGNSVQGYAGDGGPATSANLNGPEGVAVDATGTLYIADTFNHRIRAVSPSGTMTTFAANGYPGFSGDGGPAVGATLFLPTDVAVDQQGSVYIADFGNSRIRKVTNGTISTIAGSGNDQQAVDGVPAMSVRLSGPTGVAVDAAGTVYFAEGSIGSGSGLTVGDFRVWRVTTDGMLMAAAGNGINSFSGDGGAAAVAQVNTPAGMAYDTAGNLYVADSANHRVRKISPAGVITTVAGNVLPGFSGDGGPATAAQLNTPTGVAVDLAGNLFIADSVNNRIRKVFPNGTIGTVAGNGNAAFFGDGGNALAAALHAPQGVAVDTGGNVYVADTLDHRVRKIDGGGTITTVAGNDGSLNLPAAVAADAAGNLYIADRGDGKVRKLAANTGALTVVADGGMAPRGAAADGLGNVYYADAGQNVVRKIATDGTVSTIVGSGACCYAGDGGPATSARINQPWGVAVDPAGNVLLADAGNNAIRAATPGISTAFIGSVANGASNAVGPIAPGEIVVLYGNGIGPSLLTPFQLTTAGLVATQIGSYSVLFNGIAAPLLYASAGQTSAIVPYGVTGLTVQVAVQYQNQTTAPVTVELALSTPGVFTADSSGKGQARAFNQDGSVNNASQPAKGGSVVTLYATGEGQTVPPGVDGRILPYSATTALPATFPPMPALPVTVTIGGKTATVQYAGGVFGSVAGVMQLNVQVPAGVPMGDAPVVVTVGGVASQVGVTVAVTN